MVWKAPSGMDLRGPLIEEKDLGWGSIIASARLTWKPPESRLESVRKTLIRCMSSKPLSRDRRGRSHRETTLNLWRWATKQMGLYIVLRAGTAKEHYYKKRVVVREWISCSILLSHNCPSRQLSVVVTTRIEYVHSLPRAIRKSTWWAIILAGIQDLI